MGILYLKKSGFWNVSPFSLGGIFLQVSDGVKTTDLIFYVIIFVSFRINYLLE